jgi:hypothetical protein
MKPTNGPEKINTEQLKRIKHEKHKKTNENSNNNNNNNDQQTTRSIDEVLLSYLCFFFFEVKFLF